jgi:dipeptidyl aminopeptidase/acylaminoacyl peptidase
MLALLFILVAAPPEDLALRLRHLASVGSAESPAPSPDGSLVAFVTTLFGSRQAATLPVEGGYPRQLTDEPGGIQAVRWTPDAKTVLALAHRGERRRILAIDDATGAIAELDPAPGDQLLGGFTRDGKRLFYAVVEAGKVTLKQLALDSRRSVEVAPPPPAAGAPAAPAGSLPIAEALAGLSVLGPLSPDGRSLVAQVHGESSRETLMLVDLASARAEPLTPHEGKARFRFPRFSNDGKTLYVLTDQGRATLGIDAITVATRARRPLYVPPRDVEAYGMSEDGHRLAVSLDQDGESVFSLLELPGLRAQPLPQPPGGALSMPSGGESPLAWSRGGDRIFFGWGLSDDTIDLWLFRLGYGTPTRLTHSPRPGLPRSEIPRPKPLRIGDLQAWLWRPAQPARPRVVLLESHEAVRPVFDRRISALNAAGFAVLAVNGPQKDAHEAALRWLASQVDLDGAKPLSLDLQGHDDLAALVKQVQ